ncbi:MAG: hypothetical protein AAFO29_03895 [Actinomycetota bacterium]
MTVDDTGRTRPAARTRAAGWRYGLRLDPARWDIIDVTTPWRGLATVVGGWLLLAFARLGIPAAGAPRALLRFLLVGIYVWLAMAVVVWLIARLADRIRPVPGAPGFTPSLQVTGLVSQPLVVFGFVILLGQVVSAQWPFTIAAVLAALVWLPGLLVAGLASAFGRLDRFSVAAAGTAYLVWLAGAGRYLIDRVGHLF